MSGDVQGQAGDRFGRWLALLAGVVLLALALPGSTAAQVSPQESSLH